MLGLDLKPQGETLARLLEARGRDGLYLYPETVVEMPRRSTKTTAILDTVLGRAQTRPGYRCVYTAQSGTIASRVLIEHAKLLINNGLAVESPAKRQHPDKIVFYANGGRERLEWPRLTGDGRIVVTAKQLEDGLVDPGRCVTVEDLDALEDDERPQVRQSAVWAVPPDAGAVRSQASDDIVIDEAGELEGQRGVDLLDGVLPLMDTRPLGQLVVAGTPGLVRAGMFWGLLEEGRAGGRHAPGILDYAARDSDDPTDRAVWRRVHPGLASGLTTMAVLERRYHRLGPVKFAREYLCQWPPSATDAAIDAAAWAEARVDVVPAPERVGVAYDVAVDDSSAAVALAWRDEAGVAYVAVEHYRPGVGWLPDAVHALARRRRVPVRYDRIGANLNAANEVERLRGVRLVSGGQQQTMAAEQLLVSALAEGRLRHFGEPPLDSAVEGAAWRLTQGGRMFGRRSSTSDVVPLVAAALALAQFDALPAPADLTVVRAG
ncbi:MAG: hypothetical protein FWF90_15675 [Promicromonosporaceae bacterium]|nr:hypothetical protein [Promicromonosporaceae bacterium]